jgi:hypothetical protein
MEEFFKQHPALGITLIVFLLALIGFLIRMYITDTKERLAQVEDKAEEMETNYIDRFDKVLNKMDDNSKEREKDHREVLFLIEGISIKLATITEQVSAQKRICEMVQEAKHNK